MAVASSMAADAPGAGPAPTGTGPTRTCIGCRIRASAVELLRVVVAPEPAGPLGPAVVPDPRRRMAGRGAWLHPDQRCVELAMRRRAFARALRVPGPVDPTPVNEYLTKQPTRRNPAGDEKSMAQR